MAWHDDDAFWEQFRSFLFSSARLDAAPGEIDDLVLLAGVAPGTAVLDCPCGPGRHALALALRGYRVTGVDRTLGYLEEARRREAGTGLSVEWVRDDMRRFVRPGTFAMVVNLYTSFGYFEDPADDRAVARNFHESLAPGGVLVMDLMGKEVLARVQHGRDWQELPDGSLMLQEVKIDRAWTWCDNRWILVRDGERREHRVSHRLYSAAELCALLRDVGFAQVDAYGSLQGAPYDTAATRLVVVARKA